MSRPASAARVGFTAVEVLIVIGIMMIMMGVAVPTILPALRRGKVNQAVNDITLCWRQARSLAMTHTIPPSVTPGTQPQHYGIVIKQAAGQQDYVALIYDSGAADPSMLLDGGGRPVSQFFFNRNLIIYSSTSPTSGNADTGDRTIVVYAQYGTGLPIDPAAVAGGTGMVAAPTSLGVNNGQPTTLTVCPVFRLQTLDYTTTPERRGYASNFGLYHAGFTAAEEL